MKSILLIGLGRYGRHVARKLHAMHHEIMAVDKNEELVNQVLPYTNSALIADSTDGHFLESLGVRNFDACIVAIGDDFQSSLETTLRLRELGAKYIVARASSSIHEKFLLRNGADEVVYPEKQLALWTAIRCGSDHLLDYFELSKNYAGNLGGPHRRRARHPPHPPRQCPRHQARGQPRRGDHAEDAATGRGLHPLARRTGGRKEIDRRW